MFSAAWLVFGCRAPAGGSPPSGLRRGGGRAPRPPWGGSQTGASASLTTCADMPGGPRCSLCRRLLSLQENKGASGSSVNRLPGLEPPEIGLRPHGRKLPAQARSPTLWPVGVPAVRGEALICLQSASHWVICKAMISFPVLPTRPSDLVCRKPARETGWERPSWCRLTPTPASYAAERGRRGFAAFSDKVRPSFTSWLDLVLNGP